MSSQELLRKIPALNDVELALLSCLIASQHCIVETEHERLDSLQEEVQLVASDSHVKGVWY
jgi:hypothetical protein